MKIAGILLAGVFAAWLIVLGLGITLPLDGFRARIEAAASRALGREVRIDGALALRPTFGPTLIAHNVRIISPAGQDDLLRAGRVSVRLAPVALLWGEPRSKRVLIEDASVNLDIQGADALATGSAEADQADTDLYYRLLSASVAQLAQQPDLQALVLRRVVLNYRDDRTAQSCSFRLDEVSVQTRTGRPLELILQGHVQQLPYTLDLTGGSLADLLAPAGPWPLQARMSFADTRLLLSGHLHASRAGLAMTFELQADWPAELARFAAGFGQVPLAGHLSLHADQGRPVVAGELQLPVFDAVLQVGDGAGSAGDTTDQPGPFRVPLVVSIADVSFRGQLAVSGQGADAGIELALSAMDADAGGLLAALTGATGVRGRIRHIDFQASTRGQGAAGFADAVGMALQVDGAQFSYGNAAGERPVDVTLETLTLALPAGEALVMQARGTLLGEPFAVEFTAGGLQTLLAEASWPMTLSATGGGAVLDISGPLAAVDANTATRLHVGLYGKRIGDLAAWLGVSPCVETSYTLRGQLVLAEDIGRLQFLQVQTGKTRLSGELDWSGGEQLTLLRTVLHFEELDPADIEGIIPLLNQEAGEAAASDIAIDMPVFPRRIEIINADVDLVIDQVLLKLVDITEVSLSTKIREGQLQRSPFSAQIGNAVFQGYLDPETTEIAVVFENEDEDSAVAGRMDKLFSSAVRWVGSAAVVPLRWIFTKKLSAGDVTGCQVQDVGIGD